LERDIAKAEADVEGWRRGLVARERQIEAASRQVRESGA
jgi:hypothetical protein